MAIPRHYRGYEIRRTREGVLQSTGPCDALWSDGPSADNWPRLRLAIDCEIEGF